MKLRAVLPARIARAWERLAIAQLVEHVQAQSEELERLRAENERLESQYLRAEAWAGEWREDAMRLQEELAELTDRQPGLTVDGHLVLVERKEVPASEIS